MQAPATILTYAWTNDSASISSISSESSPRNLTPLLIISGICDCTQSWEGWILLQKLVNLCLKTNYIDLDWKNSGPGAVPAPHYQISSNHAKHNEIRPHILQLKLCTRNRELRHNCLWFGLQKDSQVRKFFMQTSQLVEVYSEQTSIISGTYL